MSAPRRFECRLGTRGDTRRLGRTLAAALAAGDVVLLEGPLGSGKTFLARAIIRGLGVPASVPVTSPTFELVHEFAGRIPIVHVDLYRLERGDAIRDLGLADRIARDAVALVEWAAPFQRWLGDDGIVVRLALDRAGVRRCAIEARGARGERLIDAVRVGFAPSRRDDRA